MKLSKYERWVLSNQYRVLESLFPDEAKDFAEAREALECGYELHYRTISQHVYDETLSEAECKEVLNILDMFSALKHSCESLQDKSGVDEGRVKFHGFDGNHEPKQLAYAKYFCKHDDGRFTELGVPPNSHFPALTLYRKMLAEWKKLADKHPLTKDDIIRITSV